MEVDVLYFDGCPTWRDAGRLVQAAAAAAGVATVQIRYRRIETNEEAAAVPFAGSPTILLDGRDAFGDTEPVAELACRLYPTDFGYAGLPTIEQLTEAIRARLDGSH